MKLRKEIIVKSPQPGGRSLLQGMLYLSLGIDPPIRKRIIMRLKEILLGLRIKF